MHLGAGGSDPHGDGVQEPSPITTADLAARVPRRTVVVEVNLGVGVGGDASGCPNAGHDLGGHDLGDHRREPEPFGDFGRGLGGDQHHQDVEEDVGDV